MYIRIGNDEVIQVIACVAGVETTYQAPLLYITIISVHFF